MNTYSIESIINVLGELRQCPICIKLHEIYHNEDNLPEAVSGGEVQKPENIIYDIFKACEEGNFKSVEYLISKGANVNEKGKYGSTPLHFASQNGHLNVVEYLISKGANVNVNNNNNGWTPLCCARRNDIRDYLISKGATY
jgi:ankyrin repeat protein